MAYRRKTNSALSSSDQLTRLWILRLLVHHPGCEARILNEGGVPSQVVQALGVSSRKFESNSRWSGDDDDDKQARLIMRRLRAMLKATVVQDPASHLPLWLNVGWFSDELGLDATERAVLGFAISFVRNDGLQEAVAMTMPRDQADLVGAVALALDLPAMDVGRALAPQSQLLSSRLLRFDFDHDFRLSVGLEVMETVKTTLLQHFESREELIHSFYSALPASTLGAEDYEHVSDELQRVVRLIRGAIEHKEPGVNILIHGPAGSGKTELVRLVRQLLGASAFEILEDDELEEWRRGRTDRFESLVLSQRLLHNVENTFLVFDEAESVFGSPMLHFMQALFGGAKRSRRYEKRWLIQHLESNPLPTVWIGNSFEGVEPALLRRFALVVEMPVPPRSVRERILRKHLGSLGVSEQLIVRISANKHVGPGLISTVAQSVSLLGTSGGRSVDEQVIAVLEEHLRLQGHHEPLGPAHPDDLGRFDMSLVNASKPLEEVAKGLGSTRRGKVLLYGAPGTGKTAFAHHLADMLDMPLLVRSASDLLDAYVGNTEKNIRAMFQEARRERAVLLLDEADSFLRDRQAAVRGWEVTQVNELLRQMEHFDGIFVCSTNLLDDIDPATMRRFSFKVSFSPATVRQRAKLLRTAIAQLDGPVPADGEDILLSAAKSLTGATAGDFAAVVGRFRATGKPATVQNITAAVKHELMFRPGNGKRKVGFGR